MNNDNPEDTLEDGLENDKINLMDDKIIPSRVQIPSTDM
jgi:hypothetical protein